MITTPTKNNLLIAYSLILIALTTHSVLFAPLGGSSIYTGDSHSSVQQSYFPYGPTRLSGTVDNQYGPSRMSSRIPCKQTCSPSGYIYGPCNQRDWDRLK